MLLFLIIMKVLIHGLSRKSWVSPVFSLPLDHLKGALDSPFDPHLSGIVSVDHVDVASNLLQVTTRRESIKPLQISTLKTGEVKEVIHSFHNCQQGMMANKSSKHMIYMVIFVPRYS